MDWNVTQVRVVDDRTLHVVFADGVAGSVHFEPTFFTGVFEQLQDAERFRAVELVDGTVVWPDPVEPGGVKDLDLAPDAMHDRIAAEGKMVLH
jgi:hypothetical protein